MQMQQGMDHVKTSEQEDIGYQQQAMDHVFTIQQMVQVTGLSAHTLRYYERAGLMKQPVGRDQANGYRVYTWQHVEWIEFLKRLRATGMPIRDIQRYTELIHQGEPTASERLHLLRQHRKRVETYRLEIEQHLAAITTKIACYEQEFANPQLGTGDGEIFTQRT
ncbi:MAG TPA: MerR family transcriptional regulator [Ktedonobacteraceae bacterium]|nr:MerR family transcriptional regulator [Ktedonobacteraceae bacterium]